MERRFSDLPRLAAEPNEVRAHTVNALATALAVCVTCTQNYWERDWRRENSWMRKAHPSAGDEAIDSPHHRVMHDR